jgi:hypothetical protein
VLVEFGSTPRMGEPAFAVGGRAQGIFQFLVPKMTKEILTQFRFSHLGSTIS